MERENQATPESLWVVEPHMPDMVANTPEELEQLSQAYDEYVKQREIYVANKEHGPANLVSQLK